MKLLNLVFLIIIFSGGVSAQSYLNLSIIEEIYDTPINRKEIKILNHGFALGAYQPTPGQKIYNKGLVAGSHFEEAISFVTRVTKYNDPIGNISYQTWIPSHYARLSEAVASKYKYIGNFEFSDSSGETYDMYDGNGFIILVYSFSSTGGKMVGNIIFRPS